LASLKLPKMFIVKPLADSPEIHRAAFALPNFLNKILS
jgi:hypothetical protein